MTVSVYVFQLVSCIFCGLVIGIVGRKTLLIMSSAIMCLCLACMCIISHYDLSVYYSAVVINVYIIGFCFGSGTISWLYLADILPDIGIALASSFLWVLTAVIGFGFPWIKNHFSITAAFAIYFVCTFIGLLFMIFVLPETSGKT